MKTITHSRGLALKEFIEHNGVSQAAIAEAAGSTTSTIWRQLNGKTNKVCIKTLVAIAKLCHCKLHELP